MSAADDDALRVVLDADRPERERVAWLSRLRDFRSSTQTSSFEVARALVPLLNEPLDWLSREAFALLGAAHAPPVAVGVDARGLLAASATSIEDVLPDGSGSAGADPDLGTVVAVRHATLLLPRLAVEPRWARGGPHGAAWLRRLDRDRPLLHLLGDGGALAFSLARGDDGTLHAQPTSGASDVRGSRVLRVALRTGVVYVAPEGHASCSIDGIDDRALVRPTPLQPGQTVRVGGAAVLELASLAPVWGIGHGGDEGEADAWPWPGHVVEERRGYGHVMHLPYGGRGVVSYREPIAQVVPPQTRAAVGSVHIDEEDGLEASP